MEPCDTFLERAHVNLQLSNVKRPAGHGEAACLLRWQSVGGWAPVSFLPWVPAQSKMGPVLALMRKPNVAGGGNRLVQFGNAIEQPFFIKIFFFHFVYALLYLLLNDNIPLSRYTIYSPKDGQPCMDHDRQTGEVIF